MQSQSSATTTLATDTPSVASQSADAGRDCNKGADQWAVLAVLRFFLAFLVVTGHIYCVFVNGPDWTSVGLWFNQEGSVFGFFLVSGYSIAASLDRSESGYYQRRVDRIWPLYLTTIAVGLATMLLIKPNFLTPRPFPLGTVDVWHVIGACLMLQTFVVPALAVIAPTWSLSIEWWFYMVAPLLKRCPSWLLLAMIFPSAYHFGTAFNPTDAPYLSLAWLWISGFLYYRYRDTQEGVLVLTVPALVAAISGGTLYWATLIAIFVLIFCRNIVVPAKLNKQMTFFGDVSFPLYLIHIPVLLLLSYNHISNTAVMFCGALAAAIAMLFCVDYPVRRRAKMQHA